MALYRRFAVYLYQYQGAKKGAGAGFGMIELRDGRIRMQLTGRGSAAQGNLEVYGLLDTGAPEDMAGIRLGSMQAGRFVLEAGEAIGEGKGFSDLRGIVLTARPGAERAVAALWGGTFDAGRFVQWKEPEAAAAKGDVQTPEDRKEPAVESEANEMESLQIREEETVVDEIFHRSQPEADLPVTGVEESWKEADPDNDSAVHLSGEGLAHNPVLKEPVPESLQETCMEEDSCCTLTEGILSESISSESISMESSSESACHGETPEEPVAETGNTAVIDGEKDQKATSQLDFVSTALDLVEFGIPLEMEQEKKRPQKTISESVLWQSLSKQYPKMKIPMHGDTVLCLRIRPCDINRLPKANWKYGCSHFLARHYNRYRCLILGRIRHEDGWEYFMGIPGGNTSQERQQAAEAGFDHYIGIERISPQWPEGFWLVQLQWEE